MKYACLVAVWLFLWASSPACANQYDEQLATTALKIDRAAAEIFSQKKTLEECFGNDQCEKKFGVRIPGGMNVMIIQIPNATNIWRIILSHPQASRPLQVFLRFHEGRAPQRLCPTRKPPEDSI